MEKAYLINGAVLFQVVGLYIYFSCCGLFEWDEMIYFPNSWVLINDMLPQW